MKKIFVSFLSLTLILVSCSSPLPGDGSTPVPPPTRTAIPVEDRSIFRNGLVESQQSVLEDLEGATLYQIDFTIADDLFHVSGHQEVHYTNTETVALTDVQLRLFPNIVGGEMQVSNISIDDKTVTPKYELKNSLMILPFAAPLEPGQSAVIKMDFAVTVPQDMEMNYGVLAYYDNVLALGHAYPMISVYDDEGWNAEIPSGGGDLTYADASFYVVTITAPKDVTLVVSGTQLSSSAASETQVLTVANGPARDFYLAASPEYEEITQTVGEVTIRSYAPRALEEGSRAALDVAAKSLEVFSTRYAPYPYTELDIVSTPTLAGGIEYPGLIVVTSRRYELEGEDQGVSVKQLLEGITAHEVGHQWFYNLVGDDQLDDPWLDEALAQYLTLQYFAEEYGPGGREGFINSLERRWEQTGFEKIPIGLPVAAYKDGTYGAIVYGRGPLFFIALEKEMGEDVFQEFLRDYIGHLSWGIATPEFLQSLAEQHCNCDLDEMFQEWVYP